MSVKLAGVKVGDSATAPLACLLQTNGAEALAFHLGHAIDHLHDHLRPHPTRPRSGTARAHGLPDRPGRPPCRAASRPHQRRPEPLAAVYRAATRDGPR